jgi:hypothetical protein
MTASPGTLVQWRPATPDELLQQARGNLTAMWHVSIKRAREQDGSVHDWALFVGGEFAASWDEMGDQASARDVAETAAGNFATTADMRPAGVTGDESRAELVVEGPEQRWLDDFATTIDDLDRTNELFYRAIANRRGLTLEVRRDDAGQPMIGPGNR